MSVSREERALEIVDYWNNKPGLYRCNEDTKSRAEAIRYIKKAFAGTIFTEIDDYFAPPEWRNRPFTKEEIKRSIDILVSRIVNLSYYPPNKEYLKRMPLNQFFKNKTAPYNKSWFLLSFTEPPQQRAYKQETLEDKYPTITSRLIERYKQEILGTNGYKLPDKDQQAFIRASIRLKEYLKENKVPERTHFNCNDRNVADWLFGAVFYASGRTEYTVTPGWFCSDLTFERRLPAYLQKQAIVGERMFRGRQ